MSAKKHHPYLAFFVASILLMTYQSQKGPLMPFRFINSAVNRVNSSIESAGRSVGSTINKIAIKEAELKLLREENDALRLQSGTGLEAIAESARLRKLLGLKDLEGSVAAAKVIGKGGGRWSSTFLIDKGAMHGVHKDMAVRTPDGLLGKIADSYPTTALVLLVDDVKFSAAVRLSGSRSSAVASGTGQGSLELKYVPSDVEVKEGERVITSGLDALFPRGIGVGTVSRVTKMPNELFQQIEVTPLAEIGKTEEVMVLSR